MGDIMSDRIARVDFPLPFAVGQVIEYDYPRHNFEGVPGRVERRSILVESIRDLEEQPLSELTMFANPLQRRSRYLVTGQDLHKHAQRSFYVGSMENLSVVDPPPAVENVAGQFQVWIVEEIEEFSGLATLSPAGIYRDDLADAKTWAGAFNDRELAVPVDNWAIVRESRAA